MTKVEPNRLHLMNMKYIFSSGSIIELLEIYNRYKKQLNKKLIIAGGGSLKQYIIDYINDNSLNNLISFLGVDFIMISLFNFI